MGTERSRLRHKCEIQGLTSLLITTWWLQPQDRSMTTVQEGVALQSTGETEAGDVNKEPKFPASYS